jgi:hypothetical protein
LALQAVVTGACPNEAGLTQAAARPRAKALEAPIAQRGCKRGVLNKKGPGGPRQATGLSITAVFSEATFLTGPFSQSALNQFSISSSLDF